MQNGSDNMDEIPAFFWYTTFITMFLRNIIRFKWPILEIVLNMIGTSNIEIPLPGLFQCMYNTVTPIISFGLGANRLRAQWTSIFISFIYPLSTYLYVYSSLGIVENKNLALGKQNWGIRSVSENTLIRHEAVSHFIFRFTIK